LISDQLEPTFARLRYSLGGDRPSQTTHHTLSQNNIRNSWLATKDAKNGISLMAPLKLAFKLQSLPFILHITSQMTM